MARSRRVAGPGASDGLAMLAAIGAGVGSGAPVAGWIGALAALVCGALAYGALARRVRAWGFAERDEDLLVRRSCSGACPSSPPGACSTWT